MPRPGACAHPLTLTPALSQREREFKKPYYDLRLATIFPGEIAVLFSTLNHVAT
jgi:hypothetical protein